MSQVCRALSQCLLCAGFGRCKDKQEIDEAVKDIFRWASEDSEQNDREQLVQKQLLEEVLKDAVGLLYPAPFTVRRCISKTLLKALESGVVDEVDDNLYAACVEVCSQSAAAGNADGFQGYKVLEIPSRGSIVLRVADSIGGGLETGCVLWTSGCVLLGLIVSGALDNLIRGGHILELGAGTGLVGLGVALCSQVRRVTLTDGEPAVLENLRHNVQATAAVAQQAEGLSSIAAMDVCHLEWSEPDLFALQDVDVIVGSDLVYDEAALAPLAALLRCLLRPRGRAQHALLCINRRRDSTVDKLKSTLAAEGLRWLVPELPPDAWASAMTWGRFSHDAASCGADRVVLIQVEAV